MSSPSIILVSNEPWDGIRFSKHHYAIALSQKYKTYFLNPPSSSRNLISGKVSISDSSEFPNLSIVDYTRSIGKIFNSRTDEWVLKAIQKLEGELLVWQFDPFRFGTVPEGCTRIYHVVDPYHEVKLNKTIANASELIVCVNDMIAKHYSEWDEKVHIEPHGIGPVHHSNESTGHMLLIGTINHSTDLVLLNSLLARFNDTDLVFIGAINCEPSEALDSLIKHERFTHKEPMNGPALLTEIAKAGVCLVPYLNHGMHVYRSPLKINTYVQANKPVVTTSPNYIDSLSPSHVHYAKDHDQFINLVEQVLSSSEDLDTEVLESVVAEHSYEACVDRILGQLHSVSDKNG